MIPGYDIRKIKFSTDGPTFEKAVGLYEKEKVTKFQADSSGFSAVVMGSKPYHVFISARDYDTGNCDCYLGEQDILCKHMVATAIMAVVGGKPLSKEDKQEMGTVRCSGIPGEISKIELSATKKSITSAMRYIKSYNGPSKIWFAYQNSLDEGCNYLSEIVSKLPISNQTTKLLIDMLLRLDEKLCRGGIDDSNGTVGGFIEQIVNMLSEYAKLVPECKKEFAILANKETCFGWEEPLVKMLDDDKHEKESNKKVKS